jgi:Fe2+ transport system protein FeoA
MAANPQPLTSLSLGATGTVMEIKVPSASRPRLMEMGLLIGTSVELVRFAPLGDPVEIKVRGYNLTLRRQEAEQIWVQPQATESRQAP